MLLQALRRAAPMAVASSIMLVAGGWSQVRAACPVFGIDSGGGATGAFVADTGFAGGSVHTFAHAVDTSALSGAVPSQTAMQTSRIGTFQYTLSGYIPFSPQVITLYFVEDTKTAAGQRTFNVSANGIQKLTNYDIFANAGARYKAVSATFSITADQNGFIPLQFTAVTDLGSVSGIAVSPGIPGHPFDMNGQTNNAMGTVQWRPADSPGATSFNLYRGVTPGGELSTPYATGLAGPQFVDGPLSPGQQFYYRVAAVNCAGISPLSFEEARIIPFQCGPALPPVPSIIATTSSNSNVLWWTQNSSVQVDYYVYRSLTPGGEVAPPYVENFKNTYTDTQVTPGIRYYYKVAQNNCTGTSPLSQEVSAIPCNCPGIGVNCGGTTSAPFAADQGFSGGHSVSWTTSVDNSLLFGFVQPDQPVLMHDREGTSFSYTLSGFAADSTHSVYLYFVENYWNSAGSRIFDVASNGAPLLTGFDVFATAGGKYLAVQKDFNVNADSYGRIVLTFTARRDQAKVGGILVY